MFSGSLFTMRLLPVRLVNSFLSKNSKKIAFIHFDLDTYNSTSFVLKLIKNDFQPGTIILFDEFYGFPNWEKYEYKAFKEEIEESNSRAR